VKLALFTTIYPGVEPLLGDWLRSVRRQTDRDFQLWIGLDALSVTAVVDALGGDPGAAWVSSAPGDSPAQLRERVWRQMLPACDAVVMVDSDDILAPSRVAAARAQLAKCDLAACALRLVDHRGRPLGGTLGAASGGEAASMLPRHNVFGLSNTAYRADLLRRLLPLPAGIAIADWYLATLAWLRGARLDFDPTPRMDYRQHAGNLTQVAGPFTPERVARDTAFTRLHIQLLGAQLGPDHASDRRAEFDRFAADVERFQARIVGDPEALRQYVVSLNALDLEPAWWLSVAHPSLAAMWRPERT
jgi:hypothetical protein